MTHGMTNELLIALLGATEEQKATALRVLHGEEPEHGPSEPQYEPYITLREVGRRLNVSTCSLWRWGVPGHALGGRRRFRMSEVAAYLESEAFKERVAELRRAQK